MNIQNLVILGVVGTVVAATAAAQSGAPPNGLNVNVLNTPNVTVVNPASLPVPVQLTNAPGAEIPYSFDSVGTCNDVNCFINFPPVPAGKMLVVKYVSGYARSSAGAIFDFAELVANNTENPGFGARFIFPMARIGLAGSSVIADTYAMNSSVLAFVRPGSSARLTFQTHVAGATFFAQGTISGHLINAPQ